MKLFNSNNTRFNLQTILFLLVTPLLLLSTCDVTSSDEDEPEEHADPWGLALMQGDNEIARQHQNEGINYDEGDSIELEAGVESPLITVLFLDQDGEFIEPDHLDEESSLGWNIGNGNILEIEQESGGDKWSFRFVGLNKGETTTKFHLLHGGHSDFESVDFAVRVHEISQ